MSSHLDNARKELKAQRSLLAYEIGQLERQLKKIDRAIENLAPISTNGTAPKINRTMPTRMEQQRRYDVAEGFLKDRQGDTTPFTAHDLVYITGEPESLVNAYTNVLRQLYGRGEIEVAIKGVRGKTVTTYRVKR
jgi:hypothetical protein